MTVHFDREINRLTSKIQFLGEIVQSRMLLALEAIMEKDLSKVESIIEGDKEVNDLEIEVEEECLKILALHQPVASSLRYVIACLKINTELEKIGDLAVKIAQQTHEIAEGYQMSIDFEKMASMTFEMLKLSLEALTNEDLEPVSKVLSLEDKLDDLHQENYVIISKLAEQDSSSFLGYVRHVAISRSFERIGDHCTNIAEHVEYMINGKIMRHLH
jgi:phosphate transport system protein